MLKFSIHIFKAKEASTVHSSFQIELEYSQQNKCEYERKDSILGMALIFHGMVSDKNYTIFDLSVTYDFQLVENYYV